METLAQTITDAIPAGVEAEFGFNVPLVIIPLPATDNWSILISVGHNVDGYEAALDTDGDQYGLPDGPGADASEQEVAAWIAPLVVAFLNASPVDPQTWCDSFFSVAP